MSPPARPPLVWRFPPYQPALTFLFAAGCAAVALYGHPLVAISVILLVIAALAALLGLFLLRVALVVDADGIAVRLVRRVSWVPWADVKAIGLADVRGNETVRIIRTDDTSVDVPPSLLQPVRPTSKFKASKRLLGIAHSIRAQRPGNPHAGDDTWM